MKTTVFFFLLVTLAFGMTTEGTAEVPAAAPRTEAEWKDFAAVEQFLGLTDGELDQMQQVIARIRAMGPAERATLRLEIEKFCRLPEGQREQLRQGWGWMPRGVQEAWRELMNEAAPARRAEIQQKLHAMTPDERLAYRQRLAEEYLKGKPGKK